MSVLLCHHAWMTLASKDPPPMSWRCGCEAQISQKSDISTTLSSLLSVAFCSPICVWWAPTSADPLCVVLKVLCCPNTSWQKEPSAFLRHMSRKRLGRPHRCWTGLREERRKGRRRDGRRSEGSMEGRKYDRREGVLYSGQDPDVSDQFVVKDTTLLPWWRCNAWDFNPGSFGNTRGYRGNSKCSLILQPELLEQLLRQKCNRSETGLFPASEESAVRLLLTLPLHPPPSRIKTDEEKKWTKWLLSC